MSAHRWKVGDRARLRYVRASYMGTTLKPAPLGPWQPGLEVTIVAIYPGITPLGARFDCEVDYPGRSSFKSTVLFDQLEPIIDRGSWDEIERATGWRPGKRRKVSA